MLDDWQYVKVKIMVLIKIQVFQDFQHLLEEPN